MRLEDVTHNHFLRLIDNDNMPHNPMLNLELAYSTFIAPTFKHAGMDFLYLMGDENEKFIPLFTDMGEYNRIFEDSDFNPLFYDFDYYLSSDMDLIINPASRGIKINVDQFRGMPETPVMPVNFSRFSFSHKELKVLAQNIQNYNFLTTLQQSPNKKEIIMGLADSTLLTRVAPENAEPTDGIVEMEFIYENIVTTKDGYLELFTGKNEIESEGDFYVQVVNLNHFFEYIIRMDMDGFVINPNSNHMGIGRKSILMHFNAFKKRYDDRKYAAASRYAFEL